MSENKCEFCGNMAYKKLCFNCISVVTKYKQEAINDVIEYLRNEVKELKKEDTIESHFKCSALMYAIKNISFDKMIAHMSSERF